MTRLCNFVTYSVKQNREYTSVQDPQNLVIMSMMMMNIRETQYASNLILYRKWFATLNPLVVGDASVRWGHFDSTRCKCE